jgi:hypothetical protein
MTETATMTNLERAQEMMLLPRWQLPWVAFEYSNHLCDQLGMCCEVLLTAYAHYAQEVEELPSDDVAYSIDPAGKKWFDQMRGGEEVPAFDSIAQATEHLAEAGDPMNEITIKRKKGKTTITVTGRHGTRTVVRPRGGEKAAIEEASPDRWGLL